MGNDQTADRLTAILSRLESTSIAQLQPILKQVIDTLAASHQQILATIAASHNQLMERHHQLMDEVRTLRTVKQTTNLIARRAPLPPGRPIRCLFLVHAIEFWDSWAPIYKAMAEAEDFEPIVAVINSDVPWDLPGTAGREQHAHETLTALGVPHFRLNDPSYGQQAYSYGQRDRFEGLETIKILAPDLIFRQMPWEGATPQAYYTDEIAFARLCYVPYGYQMPKRVYDTLDTTRRDHSIDHTDQYFHRMCWRIFCETDMHKSMYAQSSGRGDGNVVVTGYTKFDNLLAAKIRPPVWPVPECAGKKQRFRVIWAPHHSVADEALAFGTFDLIYKEMLAWARECDDVSFVMKPHPLLWGRLVEHKKLITKEELDAFLVAWKALPNAALVEGGDFGPLFVASDAMLTDGVSFLAEYQIFEKPLLFLDSGRHFGFNPAGAVVMEGVNTVKTIAEARAFSERLQKGEPDPKREIQKRNLSRIMPNAGRTAQKVLEAIREGLEKERGLSGFACS
jgi:hypothetical protein